MPQSAPCSRPVPPMLEQALLALLFLGGIALLSLPAARSASVTFGWMPLWLLALPAAALATAAWLRRSQRHATDAMPARGRRRRGADTATPPGPARRSAAVVRRSRRSQAA